MAWAIIIYGFIAAVLPVWMLLAPRDYLSTFMKVGVIAMLAVSIVIVRPIIHVPAMTVYATTGAGPVFSGKLFPFLFVTIACGALSGFHATISSGTTPKLIEKESQARLIGYGGMLMESFVAIMALVAALSVDRGIYFAMNSPAGATGNTVQSAVAYVNSLGLSGVHADANALTTTAKLVGETSIVSRTGGAPTLAVGLATIMHKIFGGEAMMSFWYHFAIMFEALFILTSVDAGTRVARFMLSDALGNFWPRLQDHSWKIGSWLTTAIMVAGWGSILLMGVTDPLGGINTLFPLFGIANQLLAAVALSICLVVFARAGHKWRLLIIFVVCTLIVMSVACSRTVQALRGRNIIDTEDPAKASAIFAVVSCPPRLRGIFRLSGTPSTRSTLTLIWKVSTRTRSTRDRRAPTSTRRFIVATILVVPEMVGARRHRRRRLRQLPAVVPTHRTHPDAREDVLARPVRSPGP